jgi:hypothetical protein
MSFILGSLSIYIEKNLECICLSLCLHPFAHSHGFLQFFCLESP